MAAAPAFHPLDAAPRPGARATAAAFAPHLLAFWFPGNALLFLATGPHPWWGALLFVVPIVLGHWLDTRTLAERREPLEGIPALPFDLLVYALAAVQFANVILLARLFAVQDFASLDFLVSFLVVGGGSGYQIITAHELIHRRKRGEQLLGRALLGSVLYEHFYTEHLRGHHARVGTADDPATARFGETFHRFYRRTVPAQLRSAWRLEKQRLGDVAMSNFDPRLLRSRVLHGLALEWGLALAIGVLAGPVAFAAFLLQALFATRLLEIVNYFEHWGLERRGPRPTPADSWDTHSWFTYYSLIGLSRHADHHAYGTRPYQSLRARDEAPLLPTGYIGMIPLVVLQNRRFQALASAELERRKLGPFRDGAERAAS